jgi:hypothetical protein
MNEHLLGPVRPRTDNRVPPDGHGGSVASLGRERADRTPGYTPRGRDSVVRRIGRKLLTWVAVVVCFVGVGLVAPASAHAETLPGYQSVLVEGGVAARWQPYLTYGGQNTFIGWTGSRRWSAVKCWADGSWATGNYGSNRWFKVYVYNNGNGVTWSFVHSSYVYNQPTNVPQCAYDGPSWRY